MSQQRSYLAYERHCLSTALAKYLDDLEREITLGTHERHLRVLGHLCKMILRRLEANGGATHETVAFARRLAQLNAVIEREAEQRARQSAERPSSPPSLRVVH